ncbi:MAG TPA: hypothetical protein DEP53_03195 [Bacteroidetes bacterium]|nr:hypothetical protein [Bacteroidota bacterium]
MKTIAFAVAASTMLFVNTPDRHRTIEEHYATTPSQSIELRGFTGSRMKVRCWDKNEVSIKLDISFSSSNERDEQKYLDAITLKKTQQEKSLRIDYQEPEITTRGGRSFWTWLYSVFSGSYTRKEAEGEIFVPRTNALTAEVRYGVIEMEGMKGALSLLGTGNTVNLKDCAALGEVTNDYGKVKLERCGGNLRLSSKSTTIVLDRFEGKADIDAEYSNITVLDITQSLSIRSTSATIKVDNVGGDATIRSDYTTLTVNDIKGMLTVADKSGMIRAKGMDGVSIDGEYSTMEIADVSGKAGKAITLDGQSGSITLANASGDVQINNPYGIIDLKDIRGNVEVRSKSSNIRAARVTGDWSSATEYSQVTLRDLSAKRVTVSNSSSPIDIQLKTAPTDVDIRNEYGTVELSMPPGFSGEVDINVTYAHIETNLPLSKKKSFDGGGGYAMGKIGTGNGKLSIETNSGNVKVMQR